MVPANVMRARTPFSRRSARALEREVMLSSCGELCPGAKWRPVTVTLGEGDRPTDDPASAAPARPSASPAAAAHWRTYILAHRTPGALMAADRSRREFMGLTLAGAAGALLPSTPRVSAAPTARTLAVDPDLIVFNATVHTV